MGSIYTRASDVLIWLGESDGSIDKALAMLEILESRVDPANLDWYLDGYTFNNDAESEEVIGWHALVYEDESVFPGLKKLFTNPWFSRMWVVQETSLSRRSPIVLCGNKSLSFKMLWSLRHNLALPSGYGETVRRAVGLDEYAREEVAHFAARWSRNSNLLSHSNEELLAHLLQTTWRRKCTDPRDHVFTILGFMTPDYVQTNFPDYNESVDRIFQRAMRLLLKDSGLHWLRFAKVKSRITLPSWCIDFSSEWIENDWGWSSQLRGCDVSARKDLGNVNDPDIIRVEGIKLGRISLAVQYLKQTSIPNSPQEDVDRSVRFSAKISPFFSAVYSLLKTKHNEDTANLIMRKGHIWNLIFHGEQNLAKQHRDIMHWALKLEVYLWLVDLAWRIVSKPWSQVSTVLAKKQLRAIEQGYLDKVLARLIPLDPQLHECGNQLGWVLSQLSDSSFLVTSSMVFGKADGFAEVGDELCLLNCYPAPAVLRHAQNFFKIAGFAWCYEDAVHYEHPVEESLVLDDKFTVSDGSRNGGFRLSGWKRSENGDNTRSAWDHMKDHKMETLMLIESRKSDFFREPATLR